MGSEMCIRDRYCAPAPHNASMDTVYAPAEGQRNNESKVTIHAPAWTRVVVCAGTPHNASMVTVYAPAGTTVEQRVENYYQRTGVDEGGNVRRHAA